MAQYHPDELTAVIRGWIQDSMEEKEREEFEREYNQYLDETQSDFDEEAYIKYMEQEEQSFIRSLMDPSNV